VKTRIASADLTGNISQAVTRYSRVLFDGSMHNSQKKNVIGYRAETVFELYLWWVEMLCNRYEDLRTEDLGMLLEDA
jgi:hypothetical protein